MRITKKKIVSVVAATAVVALGSTAAYAYFTTGGSGSGTAAVGGALPLTATVTVAGPALVPDGLAHGLGGTVNNPSTAPQHVSTAVVSIVSVLDIHGNPLDYSATGCDITVTGQPMVPTGGETIPAGSTTVAPSLAGGSITMIDNGHDQSACEGATVNLLLTLS